MIILDTNVLSEMMRPVPNAAVFDWLAAQPAPEVFTTAITQAEILSGLAYMPSGRRRKDLQERAGAMFSEDFTGRILAFDSQSANFYARILAARRAAGRPISELDAQIAAIAWQHDGLLATRNTADFNECGIQLVNPWQS